MWASKATNNAEAQAIWAPGQGNGLILRRSVEQREMFLRPCKGLTETTGVCAYIPQVVVEDASSSKAGD